MNALFALLNFIVSCIIWFYIAKAVRAVIDCEKHLRTLSNMQVMQYQKDKLSNEQNG